MEDEYPRYRTSAYYSDELGEIIKQRCTEDYPIVIGAGGDMFEQLRDAVNQGIDSHLEAIFFEQDGRKFTIRKDCLHVLVRRLLESDDEEANSMASGICETLDIELI